MSSMRRRQGRAALSRATEEAAAYRCDLVVINSSHGDRYVDPHFAGDAELDQVRRELVVKASQAPADEESGWSNRGPAR
jgi:hypothetical protein